MIQILLLITQMISMFIKILKITPGGRLFQSFITRMLKKFLHTLFLTNGFFILILCPIVIEVLSTWNNTLGDSPSSRRIL